MTNVNWQTNSSNGFLCMTQLSLRCADFADNFYPWDNQSLDAPEYLPSGETRYHENGDDVVIYRTNEYSYR